MLNHAALIIEHLPGSVITNLYVGIFQVVLLLVFFVLFFEFIENRSLKLLRINFYLAIIICCAVVIHRISLIMKREVIFFSGTKNISCEMNIGNDSYVFCTSEDTGKVRMIAYGNCLSEGRDPARLKTILMDDSSTVISSMLFNKSVIMTGNNIILINPPGIVPFRSLCTYYSILPNQEISSGAGNIIVNRRRLPKLPNGSDSDFEISGGKSNVHFLQDGYKIISLRQ